MPRIARRKQKHSDGSVHVSPTWHVEYTDHRGARRRLAGFTSKAATRTLAATIEELVACRATGTEPPARLARAVDALPARVLEHLAGAGLLDEVRRASVRPLADLLANWAEHLRQKGNTDRHVHQRRGRAERLLEAIGARWWQEVRPDRVEAALAAWRASGTLSVATSNSYRSALKQFLSWLCRAGLAPSNPLQHAGGQNSERDLRVRRRPLSAEECRRLVTCAPPGRALLYQTALETGLRCAELKALKACDLDLDGETPTLTVQAAYAKGGRTDTLPLRPGLAAKLAEHCEGKGAQEPVFEHRNWGRTAHWLRADLEAAGIPYRDGQGRVVDFHALRHTFITLLALAGVHPKVAQTLARHSTVVLTLDVYSHADLGAQKKAVAALPELAQTLQAT